LYLFNKSATSVQANKATTLRKKKQVKRTGQKKKKRKANCILAKKNGGKRCATVRSRRHRKTKVAFFKDITVAHSKNSCRVP
jgi:hypothetical protein